MDNHKLSANSKRWLLLTLLFMATLSSFCTDMYTPSLPILAKEFNNNSMATKLTMSSFLLGFTIGQVVVGVLSDLIGRRLILLINLAIFILFSFSIYFLDNIYQIVLFRFFQGLSVAATSVLSKSLVSDNFSGDKLNNVSIYLCSAWGLGIILAPALGGYLQFQFGWRSTFIFMTLYGLIILGLSIKNIKEPATKRRFSIANNLIVKNISLVLKDKFFISYALLIGIEYSLLVLFGIICPFIIETQMGYSTIFFGNMSLLIGMAYFFGTVLSRFIIYNISSDSLVAVCIVIELLCCILGLVFALTMIQTLFVLMVPSSLIIFCCGIANSIAMSKCLAQLPHIAGTAAAMLGSIFLFTTFIASLLVSYFSLSLIFYYSIFTIFSLFLLLLFLSLKRQSKFRVSS